MTATATPPRFVSRGVSLVEEWESISLGFSAESIVDITHSGVTTLYHECLCRIKLENSVLLHPRDFLFGLEACGDIGLLDAAMVDLTLDALETDPEAVLGCNISPKTLVSEAAWRTVIEIIESRASLAVRLVLEITESSPLDEIPDLRNRLLAAQALGCHIAVDDFGAGSASIRHLYKIKVDWDIIKIDRSCFTRLSGKSSPSRAGLQSMMALASCLAPNVVVEGIESAEHLEVARAAGLLWGQGFLFSAATFQRWKELNGHAGRELRSALVRLPSKPLEQDRAVDGAMSQTPESHGSVLTQWLRNLVLRARRRGR